MRGNICEVMKGITVVLGVALVLAAYLLGAGGPFLGDDYPYLLENEKLLSIGPGELWRLFVEPHNKWGEYLPVRDLSLWLDASLFGLTPLPFKIHNIILYGLICAAVWFCVFEIQRNETADTKNRERNAAVAGIAALIFAAHPAHVEAVSWISGRKDLLSGLFTIIAFWRFVVAHRGDNRRAANIAASTLLFLAAVFSKGAVIVFPGAALLYSLRHYMKSAPLPRALLRAALNTAPLIIVAGVALLVHTHFGEAGGVSIGEERYTQAMQADATNRLLLILGYLAKITVFPVQLRLTYDVYQEGFVSIALIGGVAAALFSIAGALLYLRRGGNIFLGLALFLIFCLPYLQIKPFETWSLASERFVFLPVFGFSLFMAGLAVKLPGRIPCTALVAALFVFGLAQTSFRAAEWKDERTLLTSNSNRSPGSYMAEFFLIQRVLLPKGGISSANEAAARIRSKELRRLVENYIRFENGIRGRNMVEVVRYTSELHNGVVNIKDPAVLRDIPHIQFLRLFHNPIIRGYKYILETDPKNASLRYNLGLIQIKAGNFDESVKNIRESLSGLPVQSRSSAMNNLGHSLWRLGKSDDAIDAFLRAMEISPLEWRAAASLAHVYRDRGDDEKADALLMEAERRAKKAGVDPSLIEKRVR